jgi:hypothetical protein
MKDRYTQKGGKVFDNGERLWGATDKLLAAANRGDRAVKLLREGFDLSAYAAALRWNHIEENTPEYVAGLQDRIEAFQEKYVAFITSLDTPA